MDDEIIPGYSKYICSKDEPDGWNRNVYTDEIYWYRETGDPARQQYYRIARWPFVPGYFLCRLLDMHTHYPVTHPFKTLKGAKAAAAVLGPQETSEVEPH